MLAKDSAKTFNIGIIGKTSVETPMRKIAEIKKVKNQHIKIDAYESIDSIRNCRILIIGKSTTDELYSILKQTDGKNILTVSDQPGFAHKGVAINFIIKNEKIKFEMNTDVIERINVKVSSHLLKLATIIREKR